MLTVEKEQIKQQLLSFNERVVIRTPGAERLLMEILTENPQIFAYVSGYSAAPSLMERGLAFKISYDNTDIPHKYVYYVTSRERLEDIYHATLAAYIPAIIIVAPPTLDVWGAYSDFHVGYGAFYSNHTSTERRGWNMGRVGLSFYRLDFNYRIGRLKLTMMEREVDKEVERLQKTLFHPDMRPETKAYIAHNYLARTVEYWLKEDANPLEMSYRQSAYGALINKKCVCQGYAEAYKRLLDTQGILNYVLCGKVKESTVNHAWNAVSFDGRDYYHVDVTWDSRGGGLSSQQYFCKSDAFMRPTRIWTRRSGVVCNSEANITQIAKEDIFFNKAKYLRCGIDPANF
ncbi:MAG: hypothetical protein IKL79_05470 [Clostridia bacterium]|nr:hypothetical protein [Clostridia bacterium]MBR3681434.1 hypothetical protein [Clostridia bacterium]